MKESPRSSEPEVTLVAAVSKDGFISRGQGVPWDLPADRTHFRSLTAGQWLLVGRQTHREMIGWFKNHHVLVLSGDPEFKPDPGERVRNVEEAVAMAKEENAPLIVIGGGKAYESALPFATRLVLTVVDDALSAGVPLPRFGDDDWRLIEMLAHPQDASHAHGFEIQTWIRR